MARSETNERVAIFGGSFNPPHVGHVLAVAYVLSCVDVDRVFVVPTFRHPFAKSLVSFDDRLEMCRLAFADLARVEVSAIEGELGGESRTVRTLEHLKKLHPHWQMHLVIGGDVVREFDKWIEPDRVRALAPPVVLGRVGYTLPEGLAHLPRVLPEVSSSEIREAIARGDVEGANALVPRRVADYVRARGLYT